MLKSRLILLEGIPGSGKSSAGTYLRRFIEDTGNTVHFWHEGDFDNPADFEGVACLRATEYQSLLTRYPQWTVLFQEYLTIHGSDHLLWYRKLGHLYPQEIPRSLVDELSHYDVYDGLPVEDYIRLALQRWRDFHQSAENSDDITILECCFLQNPLTVMLARHDVDPQMARQQIQEITGIIQSLNPLVIYLSPLNIKDALEHVHAERPREWSDFVIWYLTEQAYGKSHHLKGFEGVIQFYEMRQKLELEILNSSSVQSLIVKHSGNEWDRCDKEITAFVGPHVVR